MQDDRGERYLYQVQQAEGIRGSATQRENHCEAKRIECEQGADEVLGAFSEALSVGREQPIAGGLKRNHRPNNQ